MASDAARDPGPGRIAVRVGIVLAVLGALAAAWHGTPLGEWLRPERLEQLAAPLRDSAAGGPVTVAVFVVGGVLMVPVTALIVASALLFGPWLGALYSLAGSLSSALVGYGLGRVLWPDLVHRLAGRRAEALERGLRGHGIPVAALVRLVPLAPFTVVNLVAGSSRLRLRDFVVGSALAMTPGILAMSLATVQVRNAVAQPSAGNLSLAAAAVVLVAVAGAAVARRARRWLGERTGDEGDAGGGDAGEE